MKLSAAKLHDEDDYVCRVQISFFKPMSFCDTYYVDTDNRGLAAQHVLRKYATSKELAALNYIVVNLCSRKKVHGDEQIEPFA